MKGKRLKDTERSKGDLFYSDPRHNTVVLFLFASLDAASTYICIRLGLMESNPLISVFYGFGLYQFDSFIPGFAVHLFLSFLISGFVAYSADYFAMLHRKIAHFILIAFVVRSMLLAINNLGLFLVFSGIL